MTQFEYKGHVVMISKSRNVYEWTPSIQKDGKMIKILPPYSTLKKAKLGAKDYIGFD